MKTSNFGCSMSIAYLARRLIQPLAILGIAACQLILLDLKPSLAQQPVVDGPRQHQIWFGAFDPIYRGRRGFQPLMQEYEALLKSDSEWRIGVSNVDVFTIFTQFAEMAPNDKLKAVIEFVKSHHTKLALSTHINPYGQNDCGHNPYIESYVGHGVLQKVAIRIKNLGGTLDYIEMDEPVWFGHEFNGTKNACHAQLGEIALGIKQTLSEIEQTFPHVIVGEAEPITGTRPDWPATMFEWRGVYERVVGKPLAFVHWDVSWANQVATNQLKVISARFHSEGLAIGVIYDGDGDDTSGLDFTTKAERRFQSTIRLLGFKPDAIFESWMRFPEKLLPESEPGTMTSLLHNYIVQQRPR